MTQNPNDQELLKPIQFSATQLGLLEACPRKWWYGYVARIKSPATEGQIVGTEIHGEAEAIGRGQRKEPDKHGPRVKAALRELARIEAEREKWPTDRLVEVARDPFEWFTGWASDPAVHLEASIKIALPTIEGLPERSLIGFVDVLDGRWPVRPRILDYKTMKSIRYLKTENELAHDSQLSVYAYWASQVAPQAEGIEVGHIGIQTQGAPTVESSLAYLDRNTVEERWRDRFLPVFEQADLEYRNKKSAGEVPAKGETNGECDRYGGCFYKSTCKSASIFGAPKEVDVMAIDFKARIAELKAKNGEAPAAPAQAQPPAPAPAAVQAQAPAAPAPTPAPSGQVSIFDKLKAKAKGGASAPTEAQIDQRVDAVEAVSKSPTEAGIPPIPETKTGAMAGLVAKAKAQADQASAIPAQVQAPAPVPKAQEGLVYPVLFIDCEPSDKAPFAEVRTLEEVMEPILSQIKAATGKRWQQLPYREGPALLVEGLSTTQLPDALIVSSRSPIAEQVLEALLPRALYVVRGR